MEDLSFCLSLSLYIYISKVHINASGSGEVSPAWCLAVQWGTEKSVRWPGDVCVTSQGGSASSGDWRRAIKTSQRYLGSRGSLGEGRVYSNRERIASAAPQRHEKACSRTEVTPPLPSPRVLKCVVRQ